jgi:glyoxylase-like metal-dependent hydrolase (beta-lactamase superfamily II)/rhodanese-related sulfurtransferase
VSEELVHPVADPGLGNTSYLVDLGDGRALAVDACRDLRALRHEAETRGLQIAFAADTHLHADFLSGAVQLAATDGATILASRAGDRTFDHTGLDDGDDVDLGGLSVRALTTPGHTDEHLALLLLDGPREVGVFTGGSLIVGSAARVDLVSPTRTEELARAQYHSLKRLTQLPSQTPIWPTHGGGSFCSAAATQSGATSTVGAELAGNALLQAPDEDTFVTMLLDTLGSFPPYFLRLGEENRRGPAVITAKPALPQLAPEDVAARGALIVDARPVPSFAHSHPAGALSIPLRPAFASWLGWLAPHDSPLVILREPDQDPDEILWQALKIGYANIIGEIAGGMDAWTNAALAIHRVELVSPEQVHTARRLDIRQAGEFQSGHLSGAIHVELGDIPEGAGRLPHVPTVVMCGHGERAMSAASVLARAGHSEVMVLDGGPDDVARANGESLATGP